MIYASDPDQAPDSEFVAGELAYLLEGNRGRLLDARRTPIRVTGVRPETGAFEIEIGAFEDAGARWELSLAEIGRFQFARDARRASPATIAALETARRAFDRELVVPADPAARARTDAEIAEASLAASRLLERARPVLDLPAWVERRHGDRQLGDLLEGFLDDRGVTDLETEVARIFVSNPSSGELVKGHAIVLAELGMCEYRGEAPRDPHLFDVGRSKERRAVHIISRLGFLRALWSRLGHVDIELYRGTAADGRLRPARPASFVSATFARAVAEAHFAGGPSSQVAVMWRQRVPVARLFMTFVETPALSGRFLEAEAVLIGDPGNQAF